MHMRFVNTDLASPVPTACSKEDPKFVYYLSAEFLMGRSLLNAVYNLGIKDSYADAIKELGYDLEIAVQNERDASLGNGGLGRLAACFLDSMATLSLPGWGYGIRYRYGMFKQGLDSELKQMEMPDIWLTNGTALVDRAPDSSAKLDPHCEASCITHAALLSTLHQAVPHTEQPRSRVNFF